MFTKVFEGGKKSKKQSIKADMVVINCYSKLLDDTITVINNAARSMHANKKGPKTQTIALADLCSISRRISERACLELDHQ